MNGVVCSNENHLKADFTVKNEIVEVQAHDSERTSQHADSASRMTYRQAKVHFSRFYRIQTRTKISYSATLIFPTHHGKLA